jgi:inhibitor of the pro-sigma K processing machinery
MGIDYGILAAYAVGIIFLFIIGRLFLVPMKFVLRLVYNALIGGLVLIVINYFGGNFGFHLPFNILTSFLVGFLGIPGIILLVLLQYIF